MVAPQELLLGRGATRVPMLEVKVAPRRDKELDVPPKHKGSPTKVVVEEQPP